MSVNIRITPAAAAFYREELELTTHQALRLFVRIGGFGSGGYSVRHRRESGIGKSYGRSERRRAASPLGVTPGQTLRSESQR